MIDSNTLDRLDGQYLQRLTSGEILDHYPVEGLLMSGAKLRGYVFEAAMSVA